MRASFRTTLRSNLTRIVFGALAAAIVGCSGGVSAVDSAPPSDAGSTDTEPDAIGRGQAGRDGGEPSCPNPNACGGCSVLAAEPRTTCSDGGGSLLWMCAGTESVSCQVAGVPRNLVASVDDSARVHLSWLPPLDMTPDKYIVIRDGSTLAYVPASTTTLDDDGADPPAVTAPPSVTATNGTWAGGVRVSWSASTSSPGAIHHYSVAARQGSWMSDWSNQAQGQRAASSNITYDVEVRGDWVSVGNALTFEDTGAPLNTLLASSTVSADDQASAVRARVETWNGVWFATPTRYVVRASVDGVFAPYAASAAAADGRRGYGVALTTQWQRSQADSDANYTDVPDMTGLEWYDDTAPLDGSGRWYRAIVRTEGAEVTTAGTRAVLARYTQVARSATATCAIRAGDGALVCWPTGSPLPAEDRLHTIGAPYTKLFGGDRTICGFRSDGEPPVCIPQRSMAPTSDFVTFDPDSRCGLTAGGEVRCPWNSPAPPADARFRAAAFLEDGVGCGLRLADGHPLCWGPPGYLGEAPEEALEDIVISIYRTACGRRKTDHVPICWSPGSPVTVPAVPMASLSARGTGEFICGTRETDQKVLCFSDFPQNVESRGIGGPSDESFTSIQVNMDGYCGTLGDGTRACRGFRRLNVEAGGQFAYGAGDTCVLRDDGRLRCSDRPLLPKEHFERVAVSSAQTCAVQETTGKVSCLRSSYPVPSDIAAATAIAIVDETVCVLRGPDGKRTCWGKERSGIPLGTSQESFSFLTQADGRNFLAVRAGSGALEALPSGLPVPSGSFVAAAGGYGHSCGLRASDRRAECAGADGPLDPTETFEEIAARGSSTCAIRQSDRRLRWFGNSSSLSAFAVKSIAASESKVCALRVDNSTLACDSQLSDATSPKMMTEPLRHVAVGPSGEVCFVKYDGHLGCR